MSDSSPTSDLPGAPGAEAFDLAVIGGGINGCGVARDAAGRGLRVLLCERDDLAGATSSATSKLVHGGVRYLEQREFRLVREALREREILLETAPHLVRPLRLYMPTGPGSRSRWVLRFGLFLYDHIAGRSSLPGARFADLRTHPDGALLREDRRRTLQFADAWTDDARLTVAVARDAARRGATVRPRTELVDATGEAGAWRLRLRSAEDGEEEVRARVLVNAAGPWVADVVDRAGGAGVRERVRLVRGSHVVVPRLHDGDHGFLLQNDDGRVVFVLPFAERWSLIGTTDVPQPGPPEAPHCSDEEVDYLCRAVARWMDPAPDPADAVWRFSGLRPLVDDGSANPAQVTREYRLVRVDAPAPALHVFGGKLTTHRRLAERVLGRLKDALPAHGPDWTAEAPLPGAFAAGEGADETVSSVRAALPALEEAHARGLVARHGAEAREVLAGAADLAALGRHFGAGLYARELDWMVAQEWARVADDVLWRRSKHGLLLDEDARGAVAAYLDAKRSG